MRRSNPLGGVTEGGGEISYVVNWGSCFIDSPTLVIMVLHSFLFFISFSNTYSVKNPLYLCSTCSTIYLLKFVIPAALLSISCLWCVLWVLNVLGLPSLSYVPKISLVSLIINNGFFIFFILFKTSLFVTWSFYYILNTET